MRLAHEMVFFLVRLVLENVKLHSKLRCQYYTYTLRSYVQHIIYIFKHSYNYNNINRPSIASFFTFCKKKNACTSYVIVILLYNGDTG